nr:MAG TPA: hypothetical protein [Caudoviricetes sp.]
MFEILALLITLAIIGNLLIIGVSIYESITYTHNRTDN